MQKHMSRSDISRVLKLRSASHRAFAYTGAHNDHRLDGAAYIGVHLGRIPGRGGSAQAWESAFITVSMSPLYLSLFHRRQFETSIYHVRY